MAIYDLFSKRQKRLRGDVPDVYTYEDVPNSLRVQIIHIWRDTLGNESQWWEGEVRHSYELIVNTLCREYGLFRLPGSRDFGNRDYINEIANFFLKTTDTDEALDAIELSFKVIDRTTRNWSYLHRQRSSQIADNAILELNGRFKEHGIGFQFTDGEIIRIDSELIHMAAVKPALRLLNSGNYSGAQQEFLSAYEHYRHSKNKEALIPTIKTKHVT